MSSSRDHLASLSLAAFPAPQPLRLAAALTWHNELVRLGRALPLFVTHDLGCLLSGEPLPLLAQPPQADRRAAYHALIAELAQSPTLHQFIGLQLPPFLLAVAISRCLPASLFDLLDALPPLSPISVAETSPSHLSIALSMPPPRFALACADRLVARRTTVWALADLLDVPVFQCALMALSSSAGHRGDRLTETPELLPELLCLFEKPEATEIAAFSLGLVRELAERHPTPNAQSYPLGGLASLQRHGSLDSLLPSELALDPELFLLRLLDHESLFHGREQLPDESPAAMQVLVDVSASMRGLRQIFGRGLALGLLQQLTAHRHPVSLRFFDGRLSPPLPYQANKARATFSLMSHRGTRGQHYARVFADLLAELRQPPPLPPQQPTAAVHIITHGGCHIPRPTLQALAERCQLHVTYLLPTGPVQTDALPLFTSHQIVTAQHLRSPVTQRQHALDLLQKAVPPRR